MATNNRELRQAFNSQPYHGQSYQFGRGGCRDPGSGACRDMSELDLRHRLVQREALKGMEVHLPTDSGECKGRTAIVKPSVDGSEEPVVKLFDGYSNSGGRALLGGEIPASDFTNPHSIRSEFDKMPI
nr:hypothetical protein CFP56_71409 [Quercus suber]